MSRVIRKQRSDSSMKRKRRREKVSPEKYSGVQPPEGRRLGFCPKPFGKTSRELKGLATFYSAFWWSEPTRLAGIGSIRFSYPKHEDPHRFGSNTTFTHEHRTGFFCAWTSGVNGSTVRIQI